MARIVDQLYANMFMPVSVLEQKFECSFLYLEVDGFYRSIMADRLRQQLRHRSPLQRHHWISPIDRKIRILTGAEWLWEGDQRGPRLDQ